jgi:ABC-type dipeptide/oligopeptide/nickel transport system permease subunit
LVEIKAIVLGVFEALFLSIALTFFCMLLPVILGNVAGYYHANVIYSMSVDRVFWLFFPTATLAFVVGGIIGGFAEDLIF